MTGDFNAEVDGGPYAALFADVAEQASLVVDTYRLANPIATSNDGTFSGFKAKQTSGTRIDWIGCSRDWKVLSAAIDRTQRDGNTPSDHFPVTAILRHAQE